MNGISLGSLKNVLPDSGDSANLISTQNTERLVFNINFGKKPEGQLTVANSLSIDIIGEMKVQIKYHDITTPLTFQTSMHPVLEDLHINDNSFESTSATTTWHPLEVPVYTNQNYPEAGAENIFNTKESLPREYFDVFDRK
ncbi:unnamed protein product [Lepeophtheirus salmonis]|uniref:(salmon louse) hypothetical protein n=1 Tax=Lepeophtheirus salmonis TaxID=72036 RepID=A0A7R8CX36_LEPSM|nr:unnamed protein product [Lepeophtheirus salmonis]CAF2927222.1 unnamed protein product [Lepeophtheirus salmonis]